MKTIYRCLILSFFLASSVGLAQDKKTQPAEKVHEFSGRQGHPNRFFDPLERVYKLSGGIELKLKTQASEGHVTSRSQLRIYAKCPGSKKGTLIKKDVICGLTHFTYDAKSKVLTLNLVEYDPGSSHGYCTGEKFTDTVQVKCP